MGFLVQLIFRIFRDGYRVDLLRLVQVRISIEIKIRSGGVKIAPR